MTSLGPRAAYPAPLPAASRPNLLSSVTTETQPALGRWELGIAYKPYGTAPAALFSVDPCGVEGDESKDIPDSPAVVEWDPYVIGVGDSCSTLGGSDEVEARARTHLTVQSSHLIEQILFNNTVDGVDFGATHPNVSLSDPSLPPTLANPVFGEIYTPNAWDSVPPVKAFSDMIEAFTETLGGVRGMIHVEARMLPFISFYGLAVQNGTRLVTTLGDHIVVPGTGYTGADPEGNASSENYSWIYGTSMVEVLLGPIEVGLTAAEAINRSTNNVEYRAERMALAHWDRTAHIGIAVCLEDPAGDCSDSGS